MGGGGGGVSKVQVNKMPQINQVDQVQLVRCVHHVLQVGHVYPGTADLRSVELDKFGQTVVEHGNILQLKPSISPSDVSSKISNLTIIGKKYAYVHSQRKPRQSVISDQGAAQEFHRSNP